MAAAAVAPPPPPPPPPPAAAAAAALGANDAAADYGGGGHRSSAGGNRGGRGSSGGGRYCLNLSGNVSDKEKVRLTTGRSLQRLDKETQRIARIMGLKLVNDDDGPDESINGRQSIARTGGSD
eukprot:GHVU01204910.1.p1 GENE.GHVU01204910.1~~GHVU01204910.1.p1  ORF type:complete len:131 (-),score=41.39 GHVU01204910.1:324-692(-)